MKPNEIWLENLLDLIDLCMSARKSDKLFQNVQNKFRKIESFDAIKKQNSFSLDYLTGKL